jgi:hypothetical protein
LLSQNLQIKFGAFCQFLGFDTFAKLFISLTVRHIFRNSQRFPDSLIFGLLVLGLELKKLAGKFSVRKFSASGISQEW